MNRWVRLVAAVVISFLPTLSQLAGRPDAWFAALAKPSWNPPNWVFGPVWTTLYLMIGVALWLYWESGRATRQGFVLFALHLALNALWTVFFFGAHSPGLALIDIALLCIVVIALIATFWRARPASGALLVPYLGWLLFASALNWWIWSNN